MQSWDRSRGWGSGWGSYRPACARLCYRRTHWTPTSILHFQGILYSAVPADRYWLTLVGLLFFFFNFKGKSLRSFIFLLIPVFKSPFTFSSSVIAEQQKLQFLVAPPKASHLDLCFIFKPDLFRIDLCPSLTWLGSSHLWLWQVSALQLSQGGGEVYSAWDRRIPIVFTT